MADKKISALPSATTPLAGSEVLPIVQGGTTDQVSVANLTAGRAVSANSLALNGAASALTAAFIRNGEFSCSPFNADQQIATYSSYNDDLTNGGFVLKALVSGTPTEFLRGGLAGVKMTGANLVVGTAGKGIDFSANGGDVLSQYDEGTFTPVFNNLTVGNGTVSGRYTRVGRMVTATIRMQFGSTTAWTGTCASISGLPFASPYKSNGLITLFRTGVGWYAGQVMIYEGQSQTSFPTDANGVAFSAATPWVWANGDFVVITLTYEA